MGNESSSIIFQVKIMNQNSEYTLVIRMNQLKNLSKTINESKGRKSSREDEWITCVKNIHNTNESII